MHAVVVDVTVTDREAGLAELRENVVPRVSQAPGFVAGYWLNTGEDKGHAIVVFESQEAASTVAAGVDSVTGVVTIDNVAVHEVVASA